MLDLFESEGALTLICNRDVVEAFIGELLFVPDDVETQSTRQRALAIFKLLKDADVVDVNESAALGSR